MPKALTQQQVIDRSIAVHGNVYDYSAVVYIPQQKIKIRCKVHNTYFYTHPDKHINGGQGCPKCGFITRGKNQCKTKESFIYDSTIVHGNKYDYSESIYVGNKVPIRIRCKLHNEYFMQSPISHSRGCGCPKCGINKRTLVKTKPVEEFVKQACIVHGDKYIYDLSTYVSNGKDIKITCSICSNVFYQRVAHHLGGSGCPECFRLRLSNDKTYSLEEFIRISKSLHGDKYNYDATDYVNYSTKVKIYCNTCESYFYQVPKYHLIGKGCLACARNLLSVTHTIPYIDILRRCIEYHGDKYTYIPPDTYIGASTKISIVCPTHGIFMQSMQKHSGGQGCPSCRPQESKGEIEIREWVESLGVVVDKNDKNIISPYEIDIYVSTYKFGIEFNGVYRHSESAGRGGSYHLNKTELASKVGIHLMQFWDFEWKDKRDIVKSIILNKLGIVQNTYFARKLTVKIVNSRDARYFCVDNHIHGFRGGSKYAGLCNADGLVALVIVGSDGELVRYAVKKFCSVTGGFSRLLSYVDVKYSFVDRRIFTGNSYYANGFTLHSITPPNYFYTHNYRTLESRNKFQKHKLAKLLEDFDPTLSEVQNMYNNGYDRVFDCGHLKFIKS